MINSVPPTSNSIHGREKRFKHNNFRITIYYKFIGCVEQWSRIQLHLLNFKKERAWIPAKAYRISLNNSHPSINCPPLMDIFEIIALPPPPPTTHPLTIFSFFYSLLEIWSTKTNQWWFKLWKLIKEPNLEHLKSLCSVHLMW